MWAGCLRVRGRMGRGDDGRGRGIACFWAGVWRWGSPMGVCILTWDLCMSMADYLDAKTPLTMATDRTSFRPATRRGITKMLTSIARLRKFRCPRGGHY